MSCRVKAFRRFSTTALSSRGDRKGLEASWRLPRIHQGNIEMHMTFDKAGGQQSALQINRLSRGVGQARSAINCHPGVDGHIDMEGTIGQCGIPEQQIDHAAYTGKISR